MNYYNLPRFITAIRHTRSFRGLELWGCCPNLLSFDHPGTVPNFDAWIEMSCKERKVKACHCLNWSKLPPKFWKQLRSNRNKERRLILVRSRNCLLENSQRRVVLGYVLGDECRGETHVHFLPPSLYLGDIGRLRYVDAILGKEWEKWEHLCLLHRTVITWTDRTWVTTGLQAE